MTKPSEWPLCVDCRWCMFMPAENAPGRPDYDRHICTAHRSLVTGKPAFYPLECGDAREGVNSWCGLEGRYFEPKTLLQEAVLRFQANESAELFPAKPQTPD